MPPPCGDESKEVDELDLLPELEEEQSRKARRAVPDRPKNVSLSPVNISYLSIFFLFTSFSADWGGEEGEGEAPP